MIWLLLSISCSTFIFVVFKLFDRYEVNNLQAIVVNYFIAFLVGSWSTGWQHSPLSVIGKSWLPNVLLLGFIFITLFQVMALVSQRLGVSVVSVAVKMSLVIPVVFAFLYYNENTNSLKITGILMALVAVYLATRKPGKTRAYPVYTWLPIILFAGSGFLDAFLNYSQKEIVPQNEHAFFASSIFGMAALFGIIFILFDVIRGQFKFQWINVIGGIALGIPNYGSIYFLLKALDFKGLESSVIFPLNNVGIVALSTLLGWLLFSEHLSNQNKTGIVLSIISILLIASDNFF